LALNTQAIDANTLAELGINAISAAIDYQGCPTVITECAIVVGTYESKKTISLNVYPNPSNGAIRIESDILMNASTLELIELSGKIVYTQKIHNSTTTVHLPVSRGIYFLKITNAKGESIQEKIIIE
jgi:hypothetical protein